MTTSSRPADVILHPGKEKHVKRGHPWVFSGAIARIQVDDLPPEAGDWVRVKDAQGTFIGWGHWGTGSIAVRIVSRGDDSLPPDSRWWADKLADCLTIRRSIGLAGGDSGKQGFRWVHGEGDGLSGLVLDVYAGLVVVQTHSMGMHKALSDIADGIQQAMGDALVGIVNKSDALLAKLGEGALAKPGDGWLWPIDPGLAPTLPHTFEEHGIAYRIDPMGGQKTGFFLDQRDNRKLLHDLVGARPVLNVFSYTGGFSLAALKGGSPHVVSLDASRPAIEAAEEHARLNGFDGRHEGVCADALSYLKQQERLPPVVVLDPPAYAKSRNARHRAVQGYKRLNETALQRMPENSLLWTFSCSQVVDAALFEDTLVAAAISSGRTVRILRRLGQPADHPSLAGHDEARYLKGLVLHVS